MNQSWFRKDHCAYLPPRGTVERCRNKIRSTRTTAPITEIVSLNNRTPSRYDQDVRFPESFLIRLKWWRRFRRAKRARMEAAVMLATEGVVRGGPFKGLRYAEAASSGSSLAPKLIGTYELELHSFIEEAIARQPWRALNIGAGEGYYAVGVALRLPRVEITAFETEESGQRLCTALARTNGVETRVDVRGSCSSDELRRLTRTPALIICDVEGAELDLLDPRSAPGLRGCEMIAEVHGKYGIDMVREIASRFDSTHSVAHVRFRGRELRDAGAIPGLSSAVKLMALDERRRYGLDWIHLVPIV